MLIRKETIFKHKRIRKKDFYPLLLQIFTDAGWTDISSKPSTDYQMFFSEGEKGRDQIFINLRENYDGTPNVHFSSTANGLIDARGLLDYVSSQTPGNSGVTNPVSQSWARMAITLNADINSFANVYYSANKDRVIFIYGTELIGGYSLTYLGKPNPYYSQCSSNTGAVVGSTSSSRWGYATVGELNFIVNGMNNININSQHIPRSFSAANRIQLGEIAFNSPLAGFKGYLDGVYSITTDYLLGLDTLSAKKVRANGKVYRLFKWMNNYTGGYNYSILGGGFAIRVEGDN